MVDIKEPIDIFKVKTSHYIITAMTLVAGLSWKEAVVSVIDSNFPTPKENVKAKLFYALIITFCLVLIIYLLPNTNSELPKETQQLIKDIEEKESLKQENYKIRQEIEYLKNELYKIKNT